VGPRRSHDRFAVGALDCVGRGSAEAADRNDANRGSRHSCRVWRLRRFCDRAGVGIGRDWRCVDAGRFVGEPDVRPASVAAWAGRRILAETGRIDEVARRLGMVSLDRTARFIAFDWQVDD
jgi:hypothetical protein